MSTSQTLTCVNKKKVWIKKKKKKRRRVSDILFFSKKTDQLFFSLETVHLIWILRRVLALIGINVNDYVFSKVKIRNHWNSSVIGGFLPRLSLTPLYGLNVWVTKQPSEDIRSISFRFSCSSDKIREAPEVTGSARAENVAELRDKAPLIFSRELQVSSPRRGSNRCMNEVLNLWWDLGEAGGRRSSTVGAPITEITPWDVLAPLFPLAEMIEDKTCPTSMRHLLARDVEKVN